MATGWFIKPSDKMRANVFNYSNVQNPNSFNPNVYTNTFRFDPASATTATTPKEKKLMIKPLSECPKTGDFHELRWKDPYHCECRACGWGESSSYIMAELQNLIGEIRSLRGYGLDTEMLRRPQKLEQSYTAVLDRKLDVVAHSIRTLTERIDRMDKSSKEKTTDTDLLVELIRDLTNGQG